MILKPKIGIIFADKTIPTEQEYFEAVTQAGGEPVVLRPSSPQNLAPLSGLILTGGEDVDPDFYQETAEPFCEEIDRRRDIFEFNTLEHFLKLSKPVFAICRGVQVLNVAMGGTLYQDLSHQIQKELLPPHLDISRLAREEKRALRHPVTVKTGTKLHRILGEKLDANSRHHQAIKKLAPGLQTTAESTDGIIEAVESKNHSWVLGVQWHPESIEVRSSFVPLFKEFIVQCSLKKA